jgi:hypothetical protein
MRFSLGPGEARWLPVVGAFCTNAPTTGSNSASNKIISIVQPNKNHYAMNKDTVWRTVLQVVAAVITAIATTLGVTSCMQNL